MRPPSRQIESVYNAFNEQGWHSEFIEGRDVLRTAFEAHHTRIDLIAQAFVPLNALAIMAETKMPVSDEHMPYVLELLQRGNKQLNLGGFEYDFDRQILVFRITNLFEKELYDKDIISSMVHCAIAEIDRIVPFISIVLQTEQDLLDDLSIERLLLREDLLPPVPEQEEDTNYI